MADEGLVSGSSLTSFDDAARSAFATVRGDRQREGSKAADVSRMWMTGGGFVGVPQYHVELRVLRPIASQVDAQRQPPWTCDEWYAYHDFMPGKAPTLRVGATCTAPTNGYAFTILRAEPQGTNGGDLLLRLVVEEFDFSNEVVTVYNPQYVEQTDIHYDTTSILPDGPTGIEVQIVR
jgi:hypothetical protein